MNNLKKKKLYGHIILVVKHAWMGRRMLKKDKHVGMSWKWVEDTTEESKLQYGNNKMEEPSYQLPLFSSYSPKKNSNTTPT